ncbi:peptide deformylase, partial [Nocardia fluminea]|uniref:peptide deformylase n=1 Tax=Nocardia fluminea TaxID=134984 RepID=UPI0036721789
MTIQPVRLFGDPILRSRADAVTEFGPDLATLVADLTETMHDDGGVGMAAPQIGVGLRVFVYDTGDAAGHVVNPEWTAVGGGGRKKATTRRANGKGGRWKERESL